MDSPRKYSTTDLALSAFLQARGHEIIEIKRTGARGVFVFEDSPQLRRDLMIWGNGQQVEINVRAFVNGLRDLKGLVGV